MYNAIACNCDDCIYWFNHTCASSIVNIVDTECATYKQDYEEESEDKEQ